MTKIGLTILSLILAIVVYKLTIYIINRIRTKEKLEDETQAINRIKEDLVINPGNTFVVTKVYSRFLSKFKNVREIRVEYEYKVKDLVRSKVKVLYAYPIDRTKRIDYFEFNFYS